MVEILMKNLFSVDTIESLRTKVFGILISLDRGYKTGVPFLRELGVSYDSLLIHSPPLYLLDDSFLICVDSPTIQHTSRLTPLVIPLRLIHLLCDFTTCI